LSSIVPKDIDEYISGFPEEIQVILKNIRDVIRQEAPEAEERISYNMPTFYYHGNLVHFAVFKKHIGFYPTPGGIQAFAQELLPYKTSKGAIRFPLDQPIPYPLIRKIVAFRVKENLKKATSKKKEGKPSNCDDR